MASEHDFIYLKSKFDRLESKFTTFDKKRKDVIKKSETLSFNEKIYGESAVDKRVNSIINDSKNKVNSLISSSVHKINDYIHISKEKVMLEAKSFDAYVNDLNRSLEIINNINNYFNKKDYEKVIDLINNYINIETANNSKIIKYFELLKVISMDKLSNQYLSNFDGLHIDFFMNYVDVCKQLKANKYKTIAITKAIQYLVKYIKSSSDSKEQVYDYAKLGLTYYIELDNDRKESCIDNYTYLYNTVVKLFNELANKYYDEFDYKKVMLFLNDSKLISQSDIQNTFFKKQDCSVLSKFEYFTLKYNKANSENLILAINDTITLARSDNKFEYYSFWIKNAEFFGWNTLQIVFLKLESLLNMHEILESAVIVCKCFDDILINNFTKELLGHLVVYYNDYVMKNYKEVPLLSFLKMSVSICELCETVLTKQDTYYYDYRKICSIIFPTIKENMNYCTNLDSKFKDKLNAVYHLTAEKMFIKTSKKDINSIKSNKTLTDDVVVKIKKYKYKKSKKYFLLVGICIGVGIIALILILAK